MVLHIPIGLPGSGKSTWATMALKGVRVSSDDIREEMSGGKYVHSFEANAAVFDEFYARITRSIGLLDVIADATNLKDHYRRRAIDIAHGSGAQVHYVVFKNVGEAVRRNALREPPRRVPDEAMVRFVCLYEIALRELVQEPYDYITYIEATS